MKSKNQKFYKNKKILHFKRFQFVLSHYFIIFVVYVFSSLYGNKKRSKILNDNFYQKHREAKEKKHTKDIKSSKKGRKVIKVYLKKKKKKGVITTKIIKNFETIYKVGKHKYKAWYR